jgi:hypothetical protein
MHSKALGAVRALFSDLRGCRLPATRCLHWGFERASSSAVIVHAHRAAAPCAIAQKKSTHLSTGWCEQSANPLVHKALGGVSKNPRELLPISCITGILPRQ